MKWLKFPIAAFSIALVFACIQNSDNSDSKFASPTLKREIATCYGNTPCNACSNCSMCKHCKAGGTCGVCAPSKKEKTKPYKAPSPTSSGRCQATTQKGTQCSRNSRSGGYCWQHGG